MVGIVARVLGFERVPVHCTGVVPYRQRKNGGETVSRVDGPVTRSPVSALLESLCEPRGKVSR